MGKRRAKNPAEPREEVPPEAVSTTSQEPVEETMVEQPVSHQAEESVSVGYRTAERKVTRVKAIVQFRESQSDMWKEIVEITTISKNGAALMLSRECPVGRLVSLALQMPVELRVYDFQQDVYATLGLVQNCSELIVNGKPVYQVGVAFIGKKMPDSFKEAPTQCYRIVGRNSLGLWDVTEAATPFKNRRSTRFWRRFEVGVSLRDMINKETVRQSAFTRDVSVGGMSVWGPLAAKIGDRVKITSKEHDFFGMAMVRNRTEFDDTAGKALIHFEFDGNEFPISKIRVPEAQEPAETEGSSPDSAEPNSAEHEQGDGSEVVRF